ncbi:MAG: flagellar hook-associated protein 3 [uncultured bacterium]|nr:MAG: flagellar hook-associated protein 3 [uncultured bacterium]
MRVPDSMTYNNAIRYMNDSKAKLDKLAERATTFKNFSNSSDDPSLVSSALVLRSSILVSSGYISTGTNAQAWMENNETSFNLMNDLIGQANTIMLKGVSDTVGASERANDYAVQITQILNQAISVGNTSYNDTYLFSGNSVKTKPFELATDGSVVNYAGDSGIMKRDLAPGVAVTINTDGIAAFNPFFDALILAKHGLETNDMTEMNNALSNINSALTAMNVSRTNNAAILRQIKTSNEHLTTTQNELKGLLSIKEDANMAEAISMFNLQETTYQTVLEVCSRSISALNLFDTLQ